MTSYVVALCAVLTQDAEGVFARMVEVEKAQERERAQYGYRETQRNWDYNAKGQAKREKARERVYENLFVEGALYRRLVERDGKPLGEQERKKQDEAQARTAQQRRAARRGGRRFFPGTRYMGVGSLAELQGKLGLRAEEEGEAWVLSGEPKAGLETDPKTKEIASYRQKFWVDKKSGRMLKRWAQVTREGVDLLPGSEVTFEYGAPKEGMPWFEVRRRIEFRTKVFGVATAGGRQEHEYTEFRKYDVESTITFEK